MSVTIADVARAAGVSRSTVSKAFGSKGFVSPQTKERVIRVAAELNYRPSYVARSLSLGKSGFIGVVVTPSILSVFETIVTPIDRAIRAAGYSLLLYTTSGDPESERLCLEDLIQKRVAGVIAVPSSHPADKKCYQVVVDNGIKLVMLDRCVKGLKVPQVGGDDYEAGRLATDYLISLGHRRIAYMAIPRTSYAGRERERGFRDAMACAGIGVDNSMVVVAGLGEEHGERAMEYLLRLGDPPTAVVARHDLTAIGAMRQALAHGLRVPEDISIVGNADISLADMVRVPLTTVRHPTADMAAIGVQKLLEMLDGGEVVPKITRLPVHLVLRSSCAAPSDSA